MNKVNNFAYKCEAETSSQLPLDNAEKYIFVFKYSKVKMHTAFLWVYIM